MEKSYHGGYDTWYTAGEYYPLRKWLRQRNYGTNLSAPAQGLTLFKDNLQERDRLSFPTDKQAASSQLKTHPRRPS